MLKLIRIINNFFPKNYRNNRGSWAMIGASAIGAGASIYGSTQAGKTPKRQELTYKQLPDYPESEEARKMSWEKIQEFGKMPGYGAIAPDWGEIWENAERKIGEYYQGGPLTPGVMGTMRAGAARRRVAGPQKGYLEAAVGAQHAGAVQDYLTKQNIARAELSESGRRSWMGDIQRLSAMKPQYVTSGYTTPAESGWGESLSEFGGSMFDMMMQQESAKRQESQWNQFMDRSYGKEPSAGTTMKLPYEDESFKNFGSSIYNM